MHVPELGFDEAQLRLSSKGLAFRRMHTPGSPALCTHASGAHPT